MGFCTGTVCKSDKMQLTGKPENQKYWIYFLLLNTNPQHFGEMVAFLKNASQDPVSTNGGKPGSEHLLKKKRNRRPKMQHVLSDETQTPSTLGRW